MSFKFILFYDSDWKRHEAIYQGFGKRLCALQSLPESSWACVNNYSGAVQKLTQAFGAALNWSEILVISDVVDTDCHTLLSQIWQQPQANRPLIIFFSREDPTKFFNLPDGSWWVKDKTDFGHINAEKIHDVLIKRRLPDAKGQGKIGKAKPALNLAAPSVLKHHIIHLFLPIDMNLQIAAEMIAEEKTDAATTLTYKALAALPEAKNEASRLAAEFTIDNTNYQQRELLNKVVSLLATSDKQAATPAQFHQWLDNLDEALDRLREAIIR